MSNLKDFATGRVVTAPSPAISGTTLTLQTGEGARMPTVPFYATVHPSNDMPTLDNAEKVQVTNVTSDTLTIVRAQGDTTAKSVAIGWILSNSLFSNDITSKEDISNKVTSLSGASTDIQYPSAKLVYDQLAGKQASLGYTPVNKAGDTMLGDLIIQKSLPWLKLVNTQASLNTTAQISLYNNNSSLGNDAGFRMTSIVTDAGITTGRFALEKINSSGGWVSTLMNIEYATGTSKFYGHITPATDSTYTLGTSSLYWSNTYTDSLYLNSTAYINGSVAGTLGINGKAHFIGGTELQIDYSSNSSGQVFRTYVRDSDNTFGLYNVTSYGTFFRYVGDVTPANNKLSLMEGGGLVGIGTTAPTTFLDIKTGAGFTRGLRIGPQNTTSGDGAYIEFNTSTADTVGPQIGGIRNAAGGGAGDLVIRTGIAAGSQVERIRVDYQGYVGIGTTAPTHTLTLPSTSTGIALYNTANQTTNYERGLLYWNANILTLASGVNGTGTARAIEISTPNASGVTIKNLVSGGTYNAVINGTVPSIATNGYATIRLGKAISDSNAVEMNYQHKGDGSRTNNFYFGLHSNTSIIGFDGYGSVTLANSTRFDVSSGTQYGVSITPTLNQSGTAAYTALRVNATENSTGSGAKNLIDAQLNGTTKFLVDKYGYVLSYGGIEIANGANMYFGTGTGTKIGTATTQKLAFWNATPVVQPAHIADPTGGVVVDTEARAAIASINAFLATTGLTAAS